MLDELFPPDEHPLLVTVMLGTNDAALANVEPGATVPLDEYSENLTAIVRRVKQRSGRVIIMTPPCMDEPARLAFQREKYGDRALGRLERTNANTARYAEAAKSVAWLSASVRRSRRRHDGGVPKIRLHHLRGRHSFQRRGTEGGFRGARGVSPDDARVRGAQTGGDGAGLAVRTATATEPGDVARDDGGTRSSRRGSWEPLRGAGGRLDWTTGLRIGLGVGMAVGFAVGRWR